MKTWTKLSLRTKTIGIMAGMSLTYLVVGLALQQHVVKIWTDNQMESFKTNNASLSASIAAQFYERYGDIQAIASNGNLLSANAEVRNNTLNTYVGLYGIYDLFVLVDAKGNLVAASNVDAGGKTLATEKLNGKNFAETPWFKNAMAGTFTEDKTKGFVGTYVEDAQLDEITSEVYGQQMYGNSFSTAVKAPNGKTIGVITARANFKFVENELGLLYEKIHAQGLRDVEIDLLNQEGKKIAFFNADHYNSDKGYSRDFAVLSKSKADYYSEENVKKMLSGEKFIGFDTSKIDKNEDLISYGPVSDKKYIDSIGWKTLIITTREDVLGEVIQARNMFLVIFLTLGVIGTIFGYFFAKGLSGRLSDVANRINSEADSVTASSKKVSTAATNLASSTHEQAAAVQETVSAIDQVSAMVAKSAENAKESLVVANSSKETAEKGKEVIDAMLASMDEIQTSNSSIMDQVEASNTQISSIVKLINEIGQKTKVINDIVFQTKLLSFNASVEAARAGEHGKGFAVVAEEVGNLAQMSGNAAKEITQMLESSIQQVEKIAEESKTKISGLMEQNKEKITNGATNAKRSAEILAEIVDNVSRVGGMASEIANASKEQSQGVSEITKAMNQLGVVSQENASASQESSAASQQLLEQADELRAVVFRLAEEVHGEGQTPPPANETDSSSKSAGTGARKAPAESEKKEKSAKVLDMKSKVKEKMAKKAPMEQSASKEIKVVGGGSIPVANDPRFEEV